MDISKLLIRHVVYPLWETKNGTSRLRYLRQLEKSQFDSAEAMRERQWTDFKTLVTHAFRSCPFYRRKYEEVGLTPGDLRTPDDIARLPTTSKQEIQECLRDMLAEGAQPDRLIKDMTGGSTGTPMTVYYDRDRLDRRVAATIRHNRWAGWDIGDKVAALWGAPRDVGSGSLGTRLRASVIERRLFFDASAIDESGMRGLARDLVRYQPKVLMGYANALALFAQFVVAERIDGIHPRGIVSSAEVLTPANRTLIEAAFKCKVYDRYGCREVGIIASECQAPDGMHVTAEDVIVEALVDGVPRSDADGDVVVTDLANYVMPLIRYRTMDVGQVISSQCLCSRGLPLMKLSGGRVSDFLTTTSGKKVAGVVFSHRLTGITGVRQVQLVQDRRNAVTVHLVKGAGWSDGTLQSLVGLVHEVLGEATEVDVVYRTTIPVEPSGKYRISISTLTS